MTDDKRTQNTIAKIMIFAGLGNSVLASFSIKNYSLAALSLAVVAAGFLLYVPTDPRAKRYFRIAAIFLYVTAAAILIKTLLGR